MLRTIEAFKVFDIIWVMTRGGPANATRSLSILVYQEAFSFQRAGSGASLALIVTLIITLLAAFYIAAIRRGAVTRNRFGSARERDHGAGRRERRHDENAGERERELSEHVASVR